MRLAVTGRHGQIVRSLLERARDTDVHVECVARPEADLTDPVSITAALIATRPDVIVSAAAYTAVDLAESQPDLAHAINVTGIAAVARVAASLGIPIIHLSTDYVFDGSSQTPYREIDPTAPINIYGRTKRDGELAVAAATSDHVILRTAWVYSPCGKNFARTMLMLAASRSEISVVADQTGAPTNAVDLADAIIEIARNLLARPMDSDLRGTFHLTNAGETTWAAFAQAIFASSRAVGGPDACVIPIPSAAYPTPARRPKNSRLDCGLIARRHGIRLGHWQSSLPKTITRLVDQMHAEAHD